MLDGTILPFLNISKLIHLLNEFAKAETPHEDQHPDDRMDTTQDATMVLLQKMSKKPATVKTVEAFSNATMTG